MDAIYYNPPQDNQLKSVRYEQGTSYARMKSSTKTHATKLILPFVTRLKSVFLNLAC
jgi:hypothetical protein